MSRFRRTVHSVLSGYVALAAMAFYSLASVPLALHYLSGERFGLWALMASIGAYLNLIDFGMSTSIARLLIDHKDDRASHSYGSLIKTGSLVLTVQGAIVFLTGFFAAPFLSALLHIQPDLQDEFIRLLRWQCVVLAFSFATRICSHLLYAHQRTDINNYAQIGMFALNFVFLWIFFHRGLGVFSLVWAGLLGTIFSAVATLLACWDLSLFPQAGKWGRVSRQRFREVFDYGKDMFLVAVGAQLIMMSQTLIITRTLGLEAAAAWNVGTKMFNLLSQVLWRIPQMASPAFSEMMVRREQTKLLERYRTIFILTLSLGGFAAVSLAMCNSLFVPFLSRHKFGWPPLNDILMGVWMIILAVVHCHNSFIMLTKKIGFMCYVLFGEGIVFVCVAFLAAHWGGLPAIIASSIICSTLFSGAYGVRRICDYFNLSREEVALRWLAPMGKMLLFFAPVALLTWFAAGTFGNPFLRLILHAVVCGVAGSYFFLRFGISSVFQIELLGRVPKRINLILRRIFAVSP